MHWKERRVQSHGEFSVSCGHNLFFFSQFLIYLFDHLFSLGFFQQCSKCKHGKYYFFHTSWHHRWTITSLLCEAFYIVPWLIMLCFLIFKTSAGCVLVTGRLMAANITNAAVTKKTQILSTRASRLRPERPLKNTSSTLRGWVFTSLCRVAMRKWGKNRWIGNPNKVLWKCILSSIWIWAVGESQQVSAAGGSDVPQDTGKDPGKSYEQPGNLDRLAVPA